MKQPRAFPLNSSDLPNLDMLRAIAVLMVLLDHTYQAVVGKSVQMDWVGRLGVLFFFVHTCYVLMLSMERQNVANEPIARDFYIRRLFRIYPLSMLAVFAAYVGPYAPKLGIYGWVSNFALVQNLTYTGNAFGSIWSLPLEVQMYLFLPLLFLLARRTRNLIPLLVVWVCAVILAESHIYVSDRLNLFVYVPCFVPGVIAYWISLRRIYKLQAWVWPMTLTCLIAAFELHPNWHFSAWLTCLILGLSIPCFEQISNKHINQITLTIARYSYGIYLGHSLLLTWMRPNYRTLPVYLCMVLALAWLGFHLAEHPMIQFGKRFTSQSKPRFSIVHR